VIEQLYRLLNMSSVNASANDDRTAKARIRDAAIDCFAEHGVAATTARKVAAAADVSPGLVIHHFGSMDGLRAACDRYVTEVIRDQKGSAMAAGPGLDLLGAMRDASLGSLPRYLARVLVEDSAAVARLVDGIVADVEQYLEDGVATGMLRPTDDPRGRAVVLAAWSLGALAMHHHIERLLGVDLTAPEPGPEVAAYAAPAYEMLADGLFTDTFAARTREQLGQTTMETDA